jgi:hypothetical protein
VDDLCVIRTMHTDLVEHFQATLAMSTGSATLPLPSIGAWISYGIGTENENLPSFVVLCEEPPYAGAQVWGAGFLPPVHQGTRITPGDDPVPNLRPPARDTTLAEMEAMLIREKESQRLAGSPWRGRMRRRYLATVRSETSKPSSKALHGSWVRPTLHSLPPFGG